MIKIERFINELMSSNCYVVWDDDTHHCVIIDPGSEKAEREIKFIENKLLSLDYILLTHEHTDHTWGVNALVGQYDSKVVCSAACKDALPAAGDMYFRLYYDDPNYFYVVRRVDITADDINNELEWCGHKVEFIPVPGHSAGSVCIRIEDYLFSGDTLMQYKPQINKRNGNKELFVKSIELLQERFAGKGYYVFPGHGDSFEY